MEKPALPVGRGVSGIEVDNQMFRMKNNDINPQGVLFSILVKIPNMDIKHYFPLPRRPPAGEAGQAGMNLIFPGRQ